MRMTVFCLLNIGHYFGSGYFLYSLFYQKCPRTDRKVIAASTVYNCHKKAYRNCLIEKGSQWEKKTLNDIVLFISGTQTWQ